MGLDDWGFIYSDLWGELLYKRGLGWRVYLYDRVHNRYNPALIIDNTLELENLISYLKDALEFIKKERKRGR